MVLPVPLSRAIYLLSWILILRLSSSEEVCCCPDANLYLTCEEVTGSSKLMNNNYKCVVKKGANVNLLCQLGDADHPAIQSVVYKFFRAGTLNTKKTISQYTAKEQLCSGTTESSSCTMESVKWKAKTGIITSDEDMTNADNHFYQCLAEVTLKDSTSFIIVSRTLFLDVVFGPDPPTAPSSFDSSGIHIGAPSTPMSCSLPEANPPTEPIWEYNGNVIDIPNSIRKDRLAINEQTDDNRGTLYVMDFTPNEDVGEYKCYASYTDVFTGETSKNLISWNKLTSTGSANNIDAEYESISSKGSPLLIDKDDPVTYTAYFKASSARVNGNIAPQLDYQWFYFNDKVTGKQSWERVEKSNEYTGKFFQDNNAKISNGGRTLQLQNTYSIYSGDINENAQFKCRAVREGETSSNPPESTQFGNNDNYQRLFLPEEFNVPASYGSCVSSTESITTKVNNDYMLIEPKDGVQSKQLLIDGQCKFLFQDTILSVLSNAPQPASLSKDNGLTFPSDLFNEKFSNHQNSRCLYFQYLVISPYQSKIGAGYEIVETDKVERFETGCTDIDAATCTSATITCNNGILSLSLDSFTATQCVAALLKRSEIVVSNKKYFPQVAESCAQRNMSLRFGASDLLTTSGLTEISGDFEVEVIPAFGGKTGCSVKTVKCGGGNASGNASGNLGVKVGLGVGIPVILIIIGVTVFLCYMGILPIPCREKGGSRR